MKKSLEQMKIASNPISVDGLEEKISKQVGNFTICIHVTVISVLLTTNFICLHYCKLS